MRRAVLLCALGPVTALSVGLSPAPAAAGFIGNACLKANRPSSSRALCDCIDRVAKQEMTRQQQKKAARFFSDPHKAQQVRQSDRPSDEKLWQSYKAFSQKATKTCG